MATTSQDELYIDLDNIETYQKRCESYLLNIENAMKSISKQYDYLVSNKGVKGDYATATKKAAQTIKKRANKTKNRRDGLNSRITSDIQTLSIQLLASYQKFLKAQEELETTPSDDATNI